MTENRRKHKSLTYAISAPCELVDLASRMPIFRHYVLKCDTKRHFVNNVSIVGLSFSQPTSSCWKSVNVYRFLNFLGESLEWPTQETGLLQRWLHQICHAYFEVESHHMLTCFFYLLYCIIKRLAILICCRSIILM